MQESNSGKLPAAFITIGPDTEMVPLEEFCVQMPVDLLLTLGVSCSSLKGAGLQNKFQDVPGWF